LEQRVQVLTETRAESVDYSATELRRIERDLHDGAQARLVALSMNLGMADELFAHDPQAARQLIAEARTTTRAALVDLRDVVRGIHPPVLADRGLAGAVQALALDMALPVTVSTDLSGRPPAPVESAFYFALTECLANVGKHSGARHVWIELTHKAEVLTAIVGDDGAGGADPANGTGMKGVMRRLSAFDGTMRVSSPALGPTIITLEVPCGLSLPKIMPS
jgi:signal transduction histidine kinase